MNIHLQRLDRGFYIIMVSLIIVGLAILAYTSLSWMADSWLLWVSFFGGFFALMYLFGFVTEKILKIATKEDKT